MYNIKIIDDDYQIIPSVEIMMGNNRFRYFYSKVLNDFIFHALINGRDNIIIPYPELANKIGKLQYNGKDYRNLNKTDAFELILAGMILLLEEKGYFIGS